MPPTEPLQSAPVEFAPQPQGKKKIIFIAGMVAVILVLALLFVVTRSSPQTSVVTQYATSTGQVQYLAFQLFTDVDSNLQKQNYPPIQTEVKDTVDGIVKAIGTVGDANHKLGFIVGPIAFDLPDDRVRERIHDAFAVALEDNVAVGFHIDDSMFWGRLTQLNTVQNIEWLDWNKTPNTGRRLDWSATPTKIMPQLCVNSPAVVAAVKERAALIGEEIERGLASLRAAGKEELFIGVGAGWETMIGDDADTGKHMGYCALTNKGYSAAHPPADIDQAIVDVTKDFIDLWATSLAEAGVPDNKIYSHIALMPQINADSKNQHSYLQSIHFTPPSIAYGAHRYAGFSTYPGTAQPEQIAAEEAKHGNQPWASMEGTALDPAQAGAGTSGDSMEMYLGNLFNHGAVLVDVFGWGVGPADNPFRQTAEKPSAIAAYRKFLSGEKLAEGTMTSGGLPDKVHKIQSLAPAWAQSHASQQSNLAALSKQLDSYIQAGDMANANATADAILKMIGQ
jgi:hypothetical protein